VSFVAGFGALLLLPLTDPIDAQPAVVAAEAPREPIVLGTDEPPSIWDRLSFDADGRLRAEGTFDQPNGDDRYRGRLRARVGAHYRLLEDLVIQARLTTVSDDRDANNPHWDFGDGPDGSSATEVGFDRFFAEWTPCDDLWLRVGKQPHALAGPPVFGEFVWDDDVHSSGVAARWDAFRGDSVSCDLRLAGYIAAENGGAEDPAMLGVQGNLHLKAGKTSFTFSSSLMDWGHLVAGAPATANQGNTDPTADFTILEGHVAAQHTGGPMGGQQAFVQYMKNLRDEDSEDTGFAVGAKMGQSGKKGNVNVFGAYYDLDANSVYSPVAQDDTPIAGTGIGMGMHGILFGGQYFASDALSFKLWVITSDAEAADNPFRVRLDMDFKVL
jgi:hypothetical protein